MVEVSVRGEKLRAISSAESLHARAEPGASKDGKRKGLKSGGQFAAV